MERDVCRESEGAVARFRHSCLHMRVSKEMEMTLHDLNVFVTPHDGISLWMEIQRAEAMPRARGRLAFHFSFICRGLQHFVLSLMNPGDFNVYLDMSHTRVYLDMTPLALTFRP